MSRLEELIQILCTDGVEKRKLSEICEIRRGQRITKSELIQEGPYPVISGGVTPMGFTNDYNRNENTITVAQYGTAGFVNWQTGKFWANDVCYSVYPHKNVLNRYLYYFLLSKQDLIYTLVIDAVPAHLPQSRLASLEILIPPLPVQEEIVRILDTFTTLETELENQLEAELAARTQQYDHYREELLGLEVSNVLKSEQIDTTKRGRNNKSTDSVLMRIDELCYIQRGRVMSKDYLRDNAGIFPVYSSQTENQGVFGYINSFDFDFESLTWTTDGANAGSIFYHNQEKFSITNVCGLLRVKSPKINTKFLYYALQNTAKEYVNYGMGNPKLMSNVMGRVKIIVPPLAVQEKIVSILDRFDALVKDLKSGLPAEIALRRKQYEYYRDQLLTFKPLNDM